MVITTVFLMLLVLASFVGNLPAEELPEEILQLQEGEGNIGTELTLSEPALPVLPPGEKPYISVPQKDRLDLVLVEGPVSSAEEDLQLLQNAPYPVPKVNAENCVALLTAGIKATGIQNYSSAQNFFKRALNGDCNDGFASFYLGAVLEKEQNFEESIKFTLLAYDQLSTYRPLHRYRYYCASNLGRSLFKLKNYLKSIFYLQEIVNRYPQDLPHQYLLGVALLNIGSTDQGLVHLRKVTQLAYQIANANLFTSEAFMFLAKAEFDRNNYIVSRGHLIDAIRWNPKNQQARLYLEQVDTAIKRSQTEQFNSDLTDTFGSKNPNEL